MEGNELQRRRDALGMSREELAKALNTTSVSVWRWENGERGIPPYLELALETVERAHTPKATQAAPAPRKRATSRKWANGQAPSADGKVTFKKAAKKGGKK